MKFVAISDTHGKHRQVKLPKGDVLLHAGDITYKGRKDEVIDFLGWFAQQKFLHKIFIAGNHDFYLEQAKGAVIDSLIPKGVEYLNDSGTVLSGIRVWGSPVTPWFYNWAFNRHRGVSIQKHWDLIPQDTQVLLTHGPAYGFLDQVISEQHVGCQDLQRRILSIQPNIHVCGHIHESYGSIQRSGTKFINASLVNEQYEISNQPIVFEL